MKRLLSKWRIHKEGISNLITWLKVIYFDRDYDESYFLTILHKKLETMEKFFRSDNTYTATAIETADQIQIAKDAAYRLVEDTYFFDLVKDIDTFAIFSYDTGRFEVNESHPDYKQWRDASELSDALRAEDKKLLFEHIGKNLESWWD